MVFQLHRFITALEKYHQDCNEIMKEADIFPIEVELDLSMYEEKVYDDDDDDDEVADENEQTDSNINGQQETEDLSLLFCEE
jgi:hypothetical protein